MKDWLIPGAKEEWRAIDGYEGFYNVSNYGRVYSIRFGKVIRGGIVPNGYATVSLYRERKQRTYLVHRLVAAAFLDNREGKPFVNHIDACKTNNFVGNLEWCTPSENTQHGVNLGNITGFPKSISEATRREVRRLRSDHGLSLRRIAVKTGVSKKSVLRIIREDA